jgi:multiple sugar transport system permease protein
MKQIFWSKTFLYSLLTFYSIITILPFIWALSASFKSLNEIVAGGLNFIPHDFTFENYQQIFFRSPLFGRWFLNSVVVAICVTSLNLFFNSLAGYALARISFPGRPLFFGLILAVLLIPIQVTLIPSFLLLKYFGWLNTYQGLIIPNAVNATFIFMMRQFFLNFPKELEEAAALDGLNRWETFFQIAMPLAKPALAAQAIFVFMNAWNSFLMPLMILSDQEMYTLPLGLNTFKGLYISYWNYIMAASIVFTLPVLLIYIFFNRYFVSGMLFSGTKG